MNKKGLLFSSLLVCSFLTVNAQYTELINSNRPGTSQGAFSVGTKVLQFESGISFGNEEHDILKTDVDVFSIDYAVRYGFFKEQLEVSFIGNYSSLDGTDFRNPAVPNEFKISNFKSNTLGAKYLIYDPYKKRDFEEPNLYSWKANNSFRWRELIPAVSVYAGANFDTSDNELLPPDDKSISPKVALITQNNLEGGWVFVTNFIADRIGSDYSSFSYILTLTHAFNPKFSMFIENQGIKSDFYADNLLRFGGAYLFGNDFQLDALASINFKDTPSVFFAGIGASYRFDMHAKDELIEDPAEAKKSKKEKKEEKDKKNRKDDFIDDDTQG